jgi:iron complex outermembrane receptor protein
MKTMQGRTLARLLIGWITASLAPIHAALGADAGASGSAVQHADSLFGRVTNAATGRPLIGARVEIQGQDRVTFTDSEGEYRFTGIPPGDVMLSVSYTGLDSAVIPAVVASGTAVRKDVGLTAEIYRMSQFVVSGEREGNAEAITLQRYSAGVRNIVSTDAFGSLAGNPADLLMRMPGVVA